MSYLWDGMSGESRLLTDYGPVLRKESPDLLFFGSVCTNLVSAVESPKIHSPASGDPRPAEQYLGQSPS